MRICTLLVMVIFFTVQNIYTQNTSKVIIPTDSLYQENIKKSRLYGVYIPRDIEDAITKLMNLTDEDARKPLLKVDEGTVAKKLYFGLGRWMEYNWNMEEGSRFSHYLRKKGLIYTEDMTRFMLITFHRYLTKRPLDSDNLIKEFIKDREKKIKEAQQKMMILEETKKIIPKNR